ncbi:methyltransferase domain-containing protein [Streptomyces sp. NPDC002825]|uniref:methyltransferase domain-containing protein n=1 Tax=Streptomyces sp. NPDC002825 TaxID=3154666 RepID=UPI00332DEFF8
MTSDPTNRQQAIPPDAVTTASDFAGLGAAYDAHVRSARGRLRHDLVERRLRAELPGRPLRVLDAGCGTGETTLRLAASGHHVTAVDASGGMLAATVDRLAARPDLQARVRLLQADVEDLDLDGRFDLVCCHGVLMYLGRADKAIARLAGLVADHGLLSVLTKNRPAIGFREALRGEHATARELIESGSGVTVGNLGVRTRGDSAEELDRLAAAHGLSPLPWQGVRVLNDHRVGWAPGDEEYALALESEWAASTRDPYRQLAPLVHTLARRVPPRTPR